MFPFKVDAHQAAFLLPEQEVISEHVPVHVESESHRTKRWRIRRVWLGWTHQHITCARTCRALIRIHINNISDVINQFKIMPRHYAHWKYMYRIWKPEAIMYFANFKTASCNIGVNFVDVILIIVLYLWPGCDDTCKHSKSTLPTSDWSNCW